MSKLIERWMDAPLFNTSVSEADETLFDDTIKAIEAADRMAEHAEKVIAAQRLHGGDFHFHVHSYRNITQETPNAG